MRGRLIYGPNGCVTTITGPVPTPLSRGGTPRPGGLAGLDFGKVTAPTLASEWE